MTRNALYQELRELETELLYLARCCETDQSFLRGGTSPRLRAAEVRRIRDSAGKIRDRLATVKQRTSALVTL